MTFPRNRRTNCVLHDIPAKSQVTFCEIKVYSARIDVRVRIPARIPRELHCSTRAMAHSTKSRGSNFSSVELNQLCASWMHISQNPIVGSAQKQGTFWDRTAKHYNQNRPKDKEVRNVRSLESKWSELKRDVARFSGCYSQAVDAYHSDENEDDTLRKARELYLTKDAKGKEFQYVDQWSSLKECPLFALSVDDMKQKAAQNSARKQKGKGRSNGQAENEGHFMDAVVDLEEAKVDDGRRQSSGAHSFEGDDESIHAGEKRPIGSKMAKRQKLDENSNRIMACAQRDMANISAARLKLAESQYRMLLFSLKVADIDPECQAYFRLQRTQELRIAMAALQRKEDEFQRAARSESVPALRRQEEELVLPSRQQSVVRSPLPSYPC